MRLQTFVIAATIAAIAAGPAVKARAEDSAPDWREMNAYALGVQAYIYTFPWSYMTTSDGSEAPMSDTRRTSCSIFGT